MSTPCRIGGPLPPGDPHAISVYLPRWRDTLAWAHRDASFLAQMDFGYPRFFIPLVVQELATKLLEEVRPLLSTMGAHVPEENKPEVSALLIPSRQLAQTCRSYLQSHDNAPCAVIHATLAGEFQLDLQKQPAPVVDQPLHYDELYLVTYPSRLAAMAKAFWQHTGSGLTSRWAVYWLSHAHPRSLPEIHRDIPTELPLEKAKAVTIALHERIAMSQSTPSISVTADDVILYPTGMSGISQTVVAIKDLQGCGKVAVFGFLYVDTLKVLTEIHGMDCALYGHSSAKELDALEADLQNGMQIDALYTEFPTNPLLHTPDLVRLHSLSRRYKFFVVVDDTIGTSINLALFPFCSIICTSLTKMFSGGCNVMGGCVVLNPQGPRSVELRRSFARLPQQLYFPLDVLAMEQNSQDVEHRVRTASANAERVVDLLRSHQSVAETFYPKGSASQALFDRFRRPGAGYGFLLSIRFATPAAAIAFHDAFHVAKGPSLGTNFTLCCAYTLLAHSQELEWAAKFGVVEDLVRVSVGIEPLELLLQLVGDAMDAADQTVEEREVLRRGAEDMRLQ